MTYLFHRSTALLVAGALLASCSSAAQLAQRDEERCAARGLAPKTDAYSDCVVRMESERLQRIGARHQEQVEKSASPLR